MKEYHSEVYCRVRSKRFSSKDHLIRHLRESCLYRSENYLHKKVKFDSSDLNNLSSTSNLNKQNGANSSVIECPVCNKHISIHSFVGHMRRNSHKIIMSSVNERIEQIQCPMKFRIDSYHFSSRHHYINPAEFFTQVYSKILSIISDYFNKWCALKINFELFSSYVLPGKDNFDQKSFNTENQIITVSFDLTKVQRFY